MHSNDFILAGLSLYEKISFPTLLVTMGQLEATSSLRGKEEGQEMKSEWLQRAPQSRLAADARKEVRSQSPG